jgi:hypothetical protein
LSLVSSRPDAAVPARSISSQVTRRPASHAMRASTAVMVLSADRAAVFSGFPCATRRRNSASASTVMSHGACSTTGVFAVYLAQYSRAVSITPPPQKKRSLLVR